MDPDLNSSKTIEGPEPGSSKEGPDSGPLNSPKPCSEGSSGGALKTVKKNPPHGEPEEIVEVEQRHKASCQKEEPVWHGKELTIEGVASSSYLDRGQPRLASSSGLGVL